MIVDGKQKEKFLGACKKLDIYLWNPFHTFNTEPSIICFNSFNFHVYR